MPAFTFVDQPDRIAAEFAAPELIGLDTEFMRERTYFSQLCLVQVATRDSIYCVDPLAESGMAEFWRAADSCTWVVHSARQDIEVIYQTGDFMPADIFDTQVAAALLGYAPQIGYAGLIKELFDVELPKTHTRANWARRPLPEEFLQYAAEDVEYLLPAHDALAEQLDAAGRLEWAKADSRLLLDRSLYDIEPGNAIGRIKGARNLHGKRRHAAAQLAAWREREALQRDKPRQWILRDSTLLDIVHRSPRTAADLEKIDGMPRKLIQRAGDDILAAVHAPASDANKHAPAGPPDEAQKSLVKKMQALVAECADNLGIAAETIASKKELTSVIIGGERESRIFTGWRRELVGKQLSALL